MRKTLAILVVLIVLVGGGYLIYHNGHKKDTSQPTTTTNTDTTTPTPAQTPNSTTSTATSTVKIADLAFTPSDITVKKGTKVTWTNDDTMAHTVTGDAGGPNSSTLATGQTYSFTFSTAGTFNYHCSIHSSMTGTVTVTE